MIKKINDFLAGIPMTIVGGVFLIISLVLSLTGNKVLVDPAWVSVMICWYFVLYLSIWRIIYNHGISKISSALLISIAMIAAIAIGELICSRGSRFHYGDWSNFRRKNNGKSKKKD